MIAAGGEGGLTKRGTKKLFLNDRNVLGITAVVINWLWTFVQTHVHMDSPMPFYKRDLNT